MSKKQFNPLEYYLLKCTRLKELLENNPQCANCEHMQFWDFSPDYYRNTVLKKYCPPCPKFRGDK